MATFSIRSTRSKLVLGFVIAFMLIYVASRLVHHHKHLVRYVPLAQQQQIFARYQNDHFLAAHYPSNDIPPLIHFVWVSKYLSAPEHLPQRVLTNIEGWEKLHPQDHVILWNNAMVRQHFPHLVPLLSKIKTESWIANILRYAILAKYGGVYLDTDVVAFKNIDQLRKNTPGFTVCESPRIGWPSTTLATSVCTLACNAVIASRPQQPALKAVFKVATTETKKRIHSPQFLSAFNAGIIHYKTLWTGPATWTKMAKKYHFPILKAQTFFPCNWTNREECVAKNFVNQPNIFAMHTWEKSW